MIELVRERILSSMSKGFDGQAVLLFSGGRDSSTVAAAFCCAFPNSKLHLLLIDTGLLSRLDSTRRQAKLLKDLFIQTDIIFEIKRVSQMMRQAGMQKVESDFTKNGFSTLLICLTCKLIMNFSAARYAKELDIKLVMDGFANRQRDYPEQTPEFMNIIREMYKESDLIYISPLYDFLVDKSIVNKTLAELGVYIPKQEPICMWSDSFSKARSEEIVRYTQKTMKIIKELDPVLRC